MFTSILQKNTEDRQPYRCSKKEEYKISPRLLSHLYPGPYPHSQVRGPRGYLCCRAWRPGRCYAPSKTMLPSWRTPEMTRSKPWGANERQLRIRWGVTPQRPSGKINDVGHQALA